MRLWTLTIPFLASVLALAPVAKTQRELKDIPDPDPEIERKALQVADGFEVNLFAADPLLAKPIQMNFDAQGRLWIASSEVYPQILPGQKQNDKVLILEDTDGDGKADKTTVFADGLFIPTGLEPGDGGVYVADSTDLLHLSDTNGDGKADRRRVVLSGFGTEDTHHIIHTFRWGYDSLLYFNQSIYIHSHVETPYGVRRLNAGGIWQFRPEAVRLEVFARGWVNSWGHHYDRWGQNFATDGAGGEGINYVIPGGYYFTAAGATRIFPGLNPGSPKHCGLEVVGGRHLPDSWQGNLITNDFRANRVVRFVLSDDGAGFAAREQPELIKTRYVAFRPVDVKMGPDGAIYIADWFNPIIQHGEVDFRDPRRDKVHGRIWRVTAKGRPTLPRPKLVGATTEALLDALTAPEDWTRHHARRLLKERGADQVLSALDGWVKKRDETNPQDVPHLLEALWVYQAFDTVRPELLATLLRAQDHRVRAAATRVVGAWHARLANPLELLAARVRDDHPRVRLEAVRALGQLSSARAAEVAMLALDRPVDRFLDYGLWLTARELEPQWVPALRQGQVDFGGNVAHLLFALQAVNSPAALQSLVQLVRDGKVGGDREESVLAMLAGVGGPAELALVFDRVLAAGDVKRQVVLLAALEQAVRQRGVRPANDPARVGEFLDAESDLLRAAAARLAGLWKIEALRPRLVTLAGAADLAADVRQAALDGLVALGGPASRAAVAELAAAPGDVVKRRMAVVALAALDLPAAVRHAVELFQTSPPEGETAALVDALLRRKNGPTELANVVGKVKLPADVAKVGVRTVRLSGREAPGLVDAFTRAGGLTAAAKPLTADELRQLVADVAAHGDPARGEMVFRRKDQVCLKCHAIAGAGGQVGPDLVSVGASAPVDYLIDSILLPNKAIKENYHSLVVGTMQGQVLTGVKLRETKTELVLRTAEDREVTIPTNQIEERSNGPSLMPAGLADALTRGELIDLVRFLAELGKPGPYSVSKARQVRRWQVLEATPAARQVLRRVGYHAAAGDDPSLSWNPAYSTVAGALPLADVPRQQIPRPMTGENHEMGFVRCHLDATTAGPVRLLLNSTAGLSLWLDGTPVEVKTAVPLDLKPGRHTLTFAIDSGRRDDLRVELDDVPDSPARVQVVGGK